MPTIGEIKRAQDISKSGHFKYIWQGLSGWVPAGLTGW